MTAERAYATLNAIFDDLQAPDRFHDQWNWIEAYFCAEVLLTCAQDVKSFASASTVDTVRELREALKPFAEADLTRSDAGSGYVGWLGVPIAQVHKWQDAASAALARATAQKEQR